MNMNMNLLLCGVCVGKPYPVHVNYCMLPFVLSETMATKPPIEGAPSMFSLKAQLDCNGNSPSVWYDVIMTSPLPQALSYLAQVPSNRALMKNEIGLLVSVRRIMNRLGEREGRKEVVFEIVPCVLLRQSSSSEVKSAAQKVHDLLIPPAGSTRWVELHTPLRSKQRPGLNTDSI